MWPSVVEDDAGAGALALHLERALALDESVVIATVGRLHGGDDAGDVDRAGRRSATGTARPSPSPTVGPPPVVGRAEPAT